MTDMKRRIILKGSLAAGAVGLAVGAGLLTPRMVLAAWPKNAFDAKEIPAALNALYGSDSAPENAEVSVKAPDIAENGAVVPITIETTMAGVTNIALIAAANAMPLVADFHMTDVSEGFVSTRIKMGKTGDVVAVVKADGKLFSASKNVKVTIGGCGG